MLTFVWAQDLNGTIGADGHLPWHLPADMHHFQQVTTGHAILAGRKTFASFGRPLPHRQNLVLSGRPQSQFPAGVKVFNTPNEFLKFAGTHANSHIMIVGGRSVFRVFLPYVDFLCRTLIKGRFPGDVRMPKVDYSQFKLLKSTVGHPDSRNHYVYRFETYQRK